MVWVPELDAHEKDVDPATRLVTDPRATQWWDGEDILPHAYQPVLGIPVAVWDVYFLYGPSAHWEGDAPPRPDYWMHQLNGAENAAPFLDARELEKHAEALLPR